MTAQEQQMIDGLIQRIRGTQVQDKDLDAERYLQQGLAGSPDALYILAQTVLVQQYGLQQAQQQIQEMQAALDEARQHVQSSGGGGGFLSKIFGGGGSNQQQPQAQYQPVNTAGYPAQGYPPQGYQQGYGAPGYGPVYGQPGYAPGGGGFLRGAMQTAAGVAMGEMAFESMESLFHGFGGGGGYERPGETVVNNYYDDAGKEEHRVDDSNFYNPNDDASRQDVGGQPGQDFAGSSADSGGAEFSNDIAGNDNSDFADNSGFDDSGFDDSGSGFDDGSGGGDGSF